MADYDVKVLEISKSGNTYTYDAGGTHYAVCDTAAGTQTKAVTISEIASLTTGLSVRIKFSNAQTYNGQPKLQINSLTATSIVRMGTTAAAQYEWNAGEVLDFVYDGTNFIIQEGAVPTTTYYGGRIKLSSATNSTSEVLAATPKAVKAAYDLANGKASTSVATQSANGLMSSTDKTKLDGIATGATANVGTITGITMNGASKGTSGVVNLGTVLTSHQDISSKANRDEIGIVITGNTASQNVTSGQYVIVRNSTISGISDGLYMASSNVSAGTAFTSANLTAVPNGGLNSLNEQIGTLGIERVDFYGFTLGTAKSITAKPYKRIGYAMGVFASNPDSRFIIPFYVTIEANANSLTISQLVVSGSQTIITTGTYDVVLLLFRVMN